MTLTDQSDSVLFVSTYPPRECGIATFTRDLAEAVEKRFFSHVKSKILAMNNNGVNVYNYPKNVEYQLSDSEKTDYVKLAREVNSNDSIKVVSIQHEFGIFGGESREYGEYLLDFLAELKKPKMITFHSILPNPSEKRKEVVKKISELVDLIVVMTPIGIEILKKDYGISSRMKVIPHGIPSVSFERQDNVKKQLGFDGKILLSSFGMISRGKGYQYVIEALPEIVKLYPNLVYLIIGATHPVVRRGEGEKYRNYLDKKVKTLGLKDNVKFYNKYVKLREIIQYLKASDLYISPSLTPEQITSGTLSYALGCGRVAVSTPFLHAKDLLADGRGVLVEKFNDAESFKKALLYALSDKKKLKETEYDCYEHTRKMTWPNVALSYGEEMRKYVTLPEIYFERLPKINVHHLRKMTDDFGILQFARYSNPHKSSGYTLDDNARALLVAGRLYGKTGEKKYSELVSTYLNYLKHVQSEEGKFYNLVSKERVVNRNSWSEEAHSRAINTLGYLASIQSLPSEIKSESVEMLFRAIPAALEINSPRAISSVISGLYYFNKENYSEETISHIRELADRLVDMYFHNSSEEWKWFETELTYSNAKMCEALFYSYMVTQNDTYLKVAIESLDFLCSHTFKEGIFVPIGQNGWFKKGKERALFDQQPTEVSSTVRALILAYKITKNHEYERKTISAFNWFLGKNMLNQIVYDEKTGGCYDGIDKKDINLNQGAESTLAYLNARLSMEELN